MPDKIPETSDLAPLSLLTQLPAIVAVEEGLSQLVEDIEQLGALHIAAPNHKTGAKFSQIVQQETFSQKKRGAKIADLGFKEKKKVMEDLSAEYDTMQNAAGNALKALGLPPHIGHNLDSFCKAARDVFSKRINNAYQHLTEPQKQAVCRKAPQLYMAFIDALGTIPEEIAALDIALGYSGKQPTVSERLQAEKDALLALTGQARKNGNAETLVAADNIDRFANAVCTAVIADAPMCVNHKGEVKPAPNVAVSITGGGRLNP